MEESGVLQAARELGIGFVGYSPLGRGFLSGDIKNPADFAADDLRRFLPRFQGENFTKNLALVAQLQTLARRKEARRISLLVNRSCGNGQQRR